MRNFREKLKRAAAAFLLVFMFGAATVFAQTDREKLAEALKTNEEAIKLSDQGTAESFRAAREKYRVAADLYAAAGGRTELQAAAFVSAGIISNKLGEKPAALESFNRALPLFRSLGDKTWEAITLTHIGNIYAGTGELQKALEYFAQVLPLYRALHDKGGEAIILNNIGSIYSLLGEKRQALDYYGRALPLLRADGDKFGEAVMLSNIGLIYETLGETRKALDYFNRSLPLARAAGNKAEESRTLNNLGMIYAHLGDKPRALKFYNASLTLSRRAGSKLGEAVTLNDLGIIYADLGEKQKALDYFNRALTLDREIGDKAKEATTLNNLMFVWENQKVPRLAVLYGKQSVNIYQELRANIAALDRETQETYLKSIEEVYRHLADILISDGRLPEAQAVLSLLKDEEYGQLSRSGETADTVPYSQSEIDVVAKIDKLAALGSEQSELRKQQKEQSEQFPADKLKRLDELIADNKAANAEFEKALAALAAADKSVEKQIADIKDERNLQSALQTLGKDLNTGAVALYTVIGTEEEKDANGKPLKDKTRSKFGWVILVTPKDRKAYPIDVTNLEQLVFQFREALSSDKYDPKPLAKKIYTAIFRQTSAKQKVTLEQDLQEILGKYADKTLMWSLDGVLRYIPMAALHDGNNYLVEKYRNVVFTKESMLWLMNQPKAKARTLGLGVSMGNTNLNMSALPGVEKELTDVVRQAKETTGILEGARKLNADFTKPEILNLKDEDNPFQTVHIASHYSFNPTDQNASYLLIGDGDGKLTFGDMNAENNLFGTVDLLTLSACDTGVSGNGKEAEGFAYLAQKLGAKSVIASLWKVSDAGTPELMIRFYKLRAENPQMPKGEAFRRAQISLLDVNGASKHSDVSRSKIMNLNGRKTDLPLFVKDEKKPFAHPHYWSSFVLIGNWR